jgi:protein-S-isoprenylcysteine O-methyltransferase Ste14
MMKKASVYSHVKAVLVAPFTVTVLIPLTILYVSKDVRMGWGMGVSLVVGTLFLLGGLYLLATTIKLFAQIGKVTLAPWNPPQKLVVAGPYRYVRNPMISGVLFILLGEAVIFGSVYLLGWFLLFWTLLHLVFLFYEEPGLVKRFGRDYVIYKENVPRWIPRLSPWNGSDEKD